MTAQSRISRSIQTAILLGGAMSTAAITNVWANEDGVERIQVTGSRIKRTDMETALPVSVISSEDIAATGLTDVAGVISQLPFNTAGSFVSASGSSASNHSSSGLRGLGSNRTLVLVNGQRVAPSATFGGSSTNLNLIPIEAVERIEVLRDGASAIYGSDAIGGVMNIILKTDFEGLAVKVNTSNPTRGGRDEDGVALTFGNTGEKGRATVVVEHRAWESLKGGQRPHLEADWETGRNRSSAFAPEGSYHPITSRELVDGSLEHVEGAVWSPGADCPEDRRVAVTSNGEPNGVRCGYAFFEGKDFLPKRQKDSMFGSFGYELTDELEWHAQTLVMRDVSKTSSSSLWTENLSMGADNPNNPTFGTDNPQDIEVYHRLVDVADRESEFKTVVFDINSGLTWSGDAGTLDLNVGISRQDVDVSTNYDYFAQNLQDAVDDGSYNPFARGGNATQATLDSIRHTSTRKAESKITSVSLDWGTETDIELAGGTLAYAVGAQYLKQEYSDQQDAQSAAGNTFGAFGGNSGGERNYRAAYVEVDMPVLENLNVKIASRYDRYSLPDKGQLSSSINIRYEVMDDLVLRGSYGQGFRAPDLDDLLSEPAVSFDTIAGQDDQVKSLRTGDRNLKPETSDQFAFGVVWNITDSTELTLDYYNIKIEDEIAFVSSQEVVDLYNLGTLAETYDPARFFVTTNAAGEVETVGAGVANKAEKRTSGIDVNFRSNFDLAEFGELTYTFEGSYVINFKEFDDVLSPIRDKVGLSNGSDGEGTPEYRFTTGLVHEWKDLTTNLTLRYIDGYDGRTAAMIEEGLGQDRQDFDSFTTVDMSVSYNMDTYGRATLGARNLFDRIADINEDLRYPFYSTDNHDIMGRVVYFTYSNTF